ncbi:MAG: four helix bundle protein [Planctomycetota bacterium]
MTESERPGIQERSFAFAVRIIRLVRALPRDISGHVVSRQIARCGTSIGANVEEAQAAQSKADFARRMNIARAEAKETLYWLRLLAESEMIGRSRIEELTTEADELVRILTAIVKTSRQQIE